MPSQEEIDRQEALEWWSNRSQAKKKTGPKGDSRPPSIGFKERFIAQLTADPKARMAYLQGKFGPENVTQEKGQILINTPDGQKTLDPKGFDIGDFVDIPGELLESGAGVAGSIAGGAAGLPTGLVSGPAGPAIGATLGAGAAAGATRGALEKAFQGLSGVPSEAAKEALTSGALAGLGEGVGRGIQSLYRSAKPSSIIGKVLTRDVGPDALVSKPGYEGLQQLDQQSKSVGTDIDLATGFKNRRARAATELIERSTPGRFALAQASEKQVLQVRDKVAKLSDDLAKEARVADIVPEQRVAQAVNKTANTISTHVESLKAEAGNIFNRNMTKASLITRNRPVIPIANTVKAIEDLSEGFVGAGSDGQKISATLNQLRADLERTAGETNAIPIRYFQNTISRLLKQSEKSAPYIDGLTDRGADTKIAQKLKDAMLDDLSNAPGGGEISNLLNEARASYANIWNEIREIRNAPARAILERAEKGADESLPAVILGSKDITRGQVSTLGKYLQKTDPEALSSLQFGVFDDLIRRSTKGGTLSPATLSRQMEIHGRRLDALFESSPAARGQYEQLKKLSSLVVDRSGKKLLAGEGQGINMLSIAAVVSNFIPGFSARSVAKLLTTKEGRTAMIKALKPISENSRIPQKVISQLSALTAGALPDEVKTNE